MGGETLLEKVEQMKITLQPDVQRCISDIEDGQEGLYQVAIFGMLSGCRLGSQGECPLQRRMRLTDTYICRHKDYLVEFDKE